MPSSRTPSSWPLKVRSSALRTPPFPWTPTIFRRIGAYGSSLDQIVAHNILVNSAEIVRELAVRDRN